MLLVVDASAEHGVTSITTTAAAAAAVTTATAAAAVTTATAAVIRCVRFAAFACGCATETPSAPCARQTPSRWVCAGASGGGGGGLLVGLREFGGGECLCVCVCGGGGCCKLVKCDRQLALSPSLEGGAFLACCCCCQRFLRPRLRLSWGLLWLRLQSWLLRLPL